MKWWHWLLLALAALAAAFALGRYTGRKPDVRLEEHATETAKVQTVEVFSQRQEWVTHRDEDQERVVTRTVYRERLPDGTQREIEHSTEGEVAHVSEAAAGQGERQAARVEVREVERIVDRRVEVSTPLPDWRIGGLVGYSGGSTPGLVYGGQVERRVLGPVSLGAWGFTGGATAGGLSAGVEF